MNERPPRTLGLFVDWAETRARTAFPERSRERARRDMRDLVRRFTGLDSLITPDERMTADQLRRLSAAIEQYATGAPFSYLVGETPFLEWDFAIDARALAPRPETEALAERVIRECRANPPARILDLCCGSGVLGLALALSFPEARVWLTDLDSDALELARENVARFGLEKRVTLHRGDLWEALPEGLRFDLIVANPPYVATEDIVERGVVAFEPRIALYSTDRGMAHAKAILAALPDRLTPGGRAALELGHRHREWLTPWLQQRLPRRWRWQADPFGVVRFLFYDDRR